MIRQSAGCHLRTRSGDTALSTDNGRLLSQIRSSGVQRDLAPLELNTALNEK